jgi:hypothetical protein
MNKVLRLNRLVLLVAVVAIVAAACGDSESDTAASPTAPVGAEEPAVLPPNPNPDDTPPIAGACLEGEPDCQDNPALGDPVQDLPLPGEDDGEGGADGDNPSTGMLVGGGLTVAEALETDASGVIAVQGFLLINVDGEARLCDALAESFPPQCGGASITVTNYEEVLGTPLQAEQGVSWTDETVTFLGEIVDGTFVVDPLVAQ